MNSRFTAMRSHFTDMRSRFTVLRSCFTVLRSRFTDIHYRFTTTRQWKKLEAPLWSINPTKVQAIERETWTWSQRAVTIGLAIRHPDLWTECIDHEKVRKCNLNIEDPTSNDPSGLESQTNEPTIASKIVQFPIVIENHVHSSQRIRNFSPPTAILFS